MAKKPATGVVVTKPRSNVYTAMLAISLVAILLSILCLHLEMTRYEYKMKATGQAPAAAAAQKLA